MASTNRGRNPHGGGGSGSGGSSTIPAPTGLSATVTAENNVYLTWSPVPNATSYWVYRNNIVLSIIQATYFTDVYAASGATYTYQVAAVVDSTLGPKSSSVSIVK